MGQGASQPNALQRLPEVIDEATAQNFAGKCFDRADWETISAGTGQVAKTTFVTTVNIRNYAPSLRAWLEFWRLDELTEFLEDELDVISPADIADLEPQALEKLKLKSVQKNHWVKVMAHAQYLKSINFDKPPSPLLLWLESWRLQRLQPGLFALGVDVKEDIIDLDVAEITPLNMRLLEIKRWKAATDGLLDVIRHFDFSEDRKYAVPTIGMWLESLRLGKIRQKLEEFGAYELADLADIDDRELASLSLSKLQMKHYKQGMLQVMAAKKAAMADGSNDLPSFVGWMESWRLKRLAPKMEELGAYTQMDLLDLEPNEYQLLQMRPLEAKRFEQAMIALEEEFLGTPAPVPGGTWKEEAPKKPSAKTIVAPTSKSVSSNSKGRY